MKNNYLISFLTITFSLFLSESVFAQFKLSAEIRPRTEYRNGFKTPKAEGQEAAFFTEQRSRLYIDYQDTRYTFRLSFQDVRVWGETSQIFKEEDGNTFLSEAWAEYFFTPKLSLKAGRQIISYDNQRFIGGLEWAQQGRRHDAMLLKYKNTEQKSNLDLGFAFNSDADVAEPAYIQANGASFYSSLASNYKHLQYAWFHKDYESGGLSLLALNAGYQNVDSTESYKQTFGVVASKKIAGITFATDLYYQSGKLNQNKVNAYLVGFNVTFKTNLTPITLGVEYVSGKDDDDQSTTIKHFSPDFGTNHAHNGFMDYFFVGPANGTVGVTDIYLKTKFSLPKGSFLAHVHNFMTGSKQLNSEGLEMSKAMGTEVDLVYSLPLSKDASFNLGYSHLFASETMTALRPGDKTSNNWVWMMFTFKPTLYSKEEN